MSKILEIPKLGAFIISFVVVVMFGALLIYSLMHGGFQDNAVTGALTAQFVLSVGYWIGSSSSSADKNAIIAKQADTAAAVKP